MGCFVNLPLRWVLADKRWLDWFVAEGLCPELGLDSVSLEQPLSWHRSIAERLRSAGLSCGVHLPFARLRPGSADAGELAHTRAQLLRAAERARLYTAAHMIGHPAFRAEYGSEESPDPAWLERSRETWQPLPERAEAPLFLENIHDQTPGFLPGLVAALEFPSPRIGICFDLGHWYYFAGGKHKQDLPDWAAAYAPYLRHLHLHDNDGESSDQHLGLGQGSIPLDAFLRLLDAGSLRPGVSFEPHSGEAFMETARWFAQRPDAAALLGWTPPRGSGLPVPPEQSLAAL